MSTILRQLNTNRSPLACKHLLDLTRGELSFICALQEPPSFSKPTSPNTSSNIVYGLDSRHHYVNRYTPNARAILYAHRSLALWPETRFCDRDLAVAIWSSPFPGIEKLALLSS